MLSKHSSSLELCVVCLSLFAASFLFSLKRCLYVLVLLSRLRVVVFPFCRSLSVSSDSAAVR